jgi:hypothetical protein
MDHASIQAPAKKSAVSGKRYSKGEQDQILLDFQRSGLSPYQYCRNKSIARETLIKWLGCSPKKSMRSKAQDDRFFRIQMQGPPPSPMIIRLPHDCSIEIYHANQVQWALDLIHTHAQASC